MMKKIIIFLLSVSMLISASGVYALEETADAGEDSAYVSYAASAEKPDWYDTAKDEFTLSSFKELTELANLCESGEDFKDKIILLGSDIECSGIFLSIGNKVPFAGSFDGNGHEISGVSLYSNVITDITALFASTADTAVVKNLTVSGEIIGKRSGIVGNNAGKIENVVSKVRYEANGIAGGVCMNNTGQITECRFYGEISNIMRKYLPASGGICASSSGTIANCANYGAVAGTLYTGGITAKNSGSVTNCSNYGPVSGTEQYTGGISALCDGTVIGCKNYGDINGDLHVGGITGILSGQISSSRNAGIITADANGAGGISGRATAAFQIDGCVNYGAVVARGNNSTTDPELNNGNAGGIVGYITENKTCMVSTCANYGSVSSPRSNIGGLVGKIKTAGNTLKNCYSIADVLVENTKMAFANVVANHIGTIEYSFGLGAPGRAYAVTSASSVITECYAYPLPNPELTDGTLMGKLSAGGGDWAQGKHYPYIKALYDGNANVTSEAEFINALSAGNDIILGAHVKLTEPLTIDKSLSIAGGGFTLSGNLTIAGDNTAVRLQNVILNGGDGIPLTVQEGSVEADELRLINAAHEGISLNKGTFTAVGPLSCSNDSLPAVVSGPTAAVTGMDDSYRDGSKYYIRNTQPLWDAADPVSIVIPAEGNEGISYNIIPVYYGSNCYFMLPPEATASSLNYQTLNSLGEVLGEYTFNSESGGTVQLKHFEYTITAMQAHLPVIYFDMDETLGTVNDMNYSPGHADHCYGTFRMEVPEDIAAGYGCDTLYTDKNTDMRGRGNFSWSQSRSDGKQSPYQFKLDKKKDLLGMGKAKSWTLLAASASDQYLKNKISYDLSRDIGVKYTPEAEMVNVYLNGAYIGMYTLAEKVQINSERVDITDMEDAVDAAIEAGDTELTTLDLTGGYLLEVDNNIDDIQIRTEDGSRVTIKSPENLDAPTPAALNSRYKYINDKVIDLFRAIYGDGRLADGRHFTEAISMDSLAVYLWGAELTCTSDFSKGSTFFYKDSDSIDPIFYFGPMWDCDTSFWGFTNEWMLPDRTGYQGEKLLCNALLDHREVASYMIEYYNKNYHNLQETYQAYGQKSQDFFNLYQPGMAMSNIVYHYPNTASSTAIKNHIAQKSAWITRNINDLEKGLMAKATKGHVITDIPDPLGGAVTVSASYEDDTIKYTVKNGSGVNYPDARVYVATYADNGVLTASVCEKLSLPIGAVISRELNQPLDGKTKVFLWDPSDRPLGIPADIKVK